jgi:CRISPR-associated endonuclease/helicase Cas3
LEYLNFWGKARPDDDARFSAIWHPLAYHSLDVAAVVDVYLDLNPAVLRRLSDLLGLSRESAQRVVSYFAACHDVGKFNLAFQAKAGDVFASLFPGQQSPVEHAPHSEVGLTTLLAYLWSRWFSSKPFGKAVQYLEPLANAACGHHGRPEPTHARPLSGSVGQASRQFLDAITDLFQMSSAPWPETPELQALRDASWLMAGVITLCDWVGSSQEFFPYESPTFSLNDYRVLARRRARIAVSQCSLHEKLPSTKTGFDWLFGLDRAAGEPGFRAYSPSPLQTFADSVALPVSPESLLFILEDETGSGKTEAALTLASRLVSAGFGRGVFFSLPTQTTANAVFDRVAPVVGRFFEKGESPSVTLAHGQAKLAMARMRAKRTEAATITAELDSWAQDSAKTALLSDFGVGTIDQVAMAGLPVRHVVLRHLGLAEKVLIVDEAHACEPYLLDILANTLEQHAKLGGSAIILSATLPRASKQALLNAFAAGKSASPGPALSAEAYPLATIYSSAGPLEHPVAQKSASRDLTFGSIAESDAFSRIEELLEANRCVCWMRNTVALAQDAYRYFNERFPGAVKLVHARFTLSDRGDNDEALLRGFGKTSTEGMRAGKLVIATQVAEQSLDVDFDEMFSDLAPIDSLLQRNGRRRRHVRDGRGNPARVEGRAPGAFYVVMPTSLEDPRFLSELAGGTAYVYPIPAVLWRTARIVRDWSTIEIPRQVREAVEFAYADESPTPTFLEEAQNRSDGKILAAHQYARVAQLRLPHGYTTEAGIELSERSVTRLGEPSVRVVLCNQAGEPIIGEGAEGRALSQIALRAKLFSEPVHDDGHIYLKMRDVDGHSQRCEVRDSYGRLFEARYNRNVGFSMTRTGVK